MCLMDYFSLCDMVAQAGLSFSCPPFSLSTPFLHCDQLFNDLN